MHQEGTGNRAVVVAEDSKVAAGLGCSLGASGSQGLVEEHLGSLGQLGMRQEDIQRELVDSQQVVGGNQRDSLAEDMAELENSQVGDMLAGDMLAGDKLGKLGEPFEWAWGKLLHHQEASLAEVNQQLGT